MLAVLFIPNRPLRTTIDLKPQGEQAVPVEDSDVQGETAVDMQKDEARTDTADTTEIAPVTAPVGKHEAAEGSAPFDGLSTDARDRLLSLLLPKPAETLDALEEAEVLRAEVAELQQELDSKMLSFDAVCERLRRLGLSEDQIARVLGDVHVPDVHSRFDASHN